MIERNYYTILGIKRTDDLAQIRGAYVQRLKDAHPDVDQRNGYPRPRIEDLQKAYRCLRDAEFRAAHDAELQAIELAYHARLQRIQRRLITMDPRKTRPPRKRSPRPAAAHALRWKLILFTAVSVAAALAFTNHL